MWLLLSGFLGLGFAQEHVQDVYTTLSEQYDDGMLQKAAIEGMRRIWDSHTSTGGAWVGHRSCYGRFSSVPGRSSSG